MILKDFIPHIALREFIQCYRIVHLEFDKSAERPCKLYTPKPEAHLSFYLKEREELALGEGEAKDFQFSVGLFGQQTSMMKRYAGRSFINFQIVFQPTALFRLTGIPSNEFTNKCVDARSVFSNNIVLLMEQLQEAKSYGEMLLNAESFVKELIRKIKKEAHQLDAVSRFMIQDAENISVDRLARETNLCLRQFQRKFNERAGVNPKTFARIIRLNRAYNLRNAHPDWDWLKVAIESDYYDYQHLVKDYQCFTGLNPGQLHQLEQKSPECRLGLAKELYKSRVSPLAV